MSPPPPPLQGFEMFRADETLCDVVLVPGDSDETFRVHRVIMASSSDYFKAMFTGGGNHRSHSVVEMTVTTLNTGQRQRF